MNIIILVIFIIGLLLCIFLQIRNAIVFKLRTKWNDYVNEYRKYILYNNYNEYKKLNSIYSYEDMINIIESYYIMTFKFWKTKLHQFIIKKDDVELFNKIMSINIEKLKNMEKSKKIMEEFSNIIWNNDSLSDDEKNELDLFNNYNYIIYYDDIIIYDPNKSDRGWDHKKDNFKRTIKEQCMFELEQYKEKIERLLNILKSSKLKEETDDYLFK